MRAFFAWLAKGAEERKGVPSSIRQMMVLGCLLMFSVIGIVVAAWCVASWHEKKLVDLPNSITALIGSTLGLLLGAKVAQSFGEPAAQPEQPQMPTCPPQ